MKKIITAINNPKLNENLKDEELIEIVCKDFQYKEAIIEYLEKNNKVDLIIINEEIPGDVKLIELIKKIKKENNNIEIIIILLKENSVLENELKKNKVKKIYYENKITLDELIRKIKTEEIDEHEELKKEISELKKLILEKESNNNPKRFINEKEVVDSNVFREKIITVTGDRKVGKTTMIIELYKYLMNLNVAVCLVDLSAFMNLAMHLEFSNIEINKDVVVNKRQEIVNEDFKLISKYRKRYDYILVDYQFTNCEEFIKLYKLSSSILYFSEDTISEIEKNKKIINKLKNKIDNKKIKIIINKSNSKYSVSYSILKKIFNESIINKKYNKMNFKLINFI